MIVEKFGVIFPRDEVKTYCCSEGDLEVELGLCPLDGNRGNRKLTKQIGQMSFLSLKKDEDYTVQLAEKGKHATHINQYCPEAVVELPYEDTDEKDFTRREVGCWRIRPGEFPLKLADDNSAIKAGDKLEIKDPIKGLDKSTATTNVVTAVESIPANTGGTIRVDIDGVEIRVKA